MNTHSSPLDRPASIPVLRRLLAAGVLTSPETRTLEAQARRDLPWRLWLDRGLLSLGAVLIVAGIGFFFAHNWNHLTDGDKLGLAAGAVLAALAGGTWAGFERFAGKILLLAASALVGVFLAVFGQVYQTGAQDYELFRGWALLVCPWVILGRFMPLWIFWLSLLNLSLGYFWPVTSFLGLLDDWSLFRHETVSLLLLNGSALLIREVVAYRPPAWFDRGWSALLLLAATIFPASVETIAEILHSWDRGATQGNAVFTCLLYAYFVAALGFYYSRVRYSLPALAIATLSACTVLTFLTIRVVNFDQPGLGGGLFLLTGIIVLVIFGSGGFFLRWQRLSHSKP